MILNGVDVYKLYPALMKYPMIIKILLENKNENGISCITQKEISMKLNICQTAVSKYMKRLVEFDECIYKLKSGMYIVNHKIWNVLAQLVK